MPIAKDTLKTGKSLVRGDRRHVTITVFALKGRRMPKMVTLQIHPPGGPYDDDSMTGIELPLIHLVETLDELSRKIDLPAAQSNA